MNIRDYIKYVYNKKVGKDDIVYTWGNDYQWLEPYTPNGQFKDYQIEVKERYGITGNLFELYNNLTEGKAKQNHNAVEDALMLRTLYKVLDRHGEYLIKELKVRQYISRIEGESKFAMRALTNEESYEIGI